MKRIFSLLLPLALIICLFSCSASGVSRGSDGSAGGESGDVTIDWSTRCAGDAGKFAELYNVSQENPYIFATFDELVTQFELGSGVVAFGFPDCPRCQNVFPVLEKVFKETKMDKHAGYRGKILYYNIYDDREAGNERYQTLLGYLDGFLNHDDSGNPRIFVPDIYFLNSGKIVGNHMDTVPSLTDPRDPLSEEQTMELMGIYSSLILEIEDCDC